MSKSYTLNRNINNFFLKGDTVTIVSDWGSLIYISNGFHRVAVETTTIFTVDHNPLWTLA